MGDQESGSKISISIGGSNTGQVAGGSNINQVSGGAGEGAAAEEARLPQAVVAQRRRLVRALEQGYNLDELQRLCFTLNVGYENLPGHTLSGKAIGLVDYLTRRERLDELAAAVRQERPGLLD